MPPAIFPKSIATASLLAHISTAKFVDGIPLYRQEPQFDRLGIALGRATMAIWMIRLGGSFIVPLINLLNELLLSDPVVHCDETRLQVLKSDKAPTADHWIWVRAAGPPGRRIVLFDYDPSRGGAVPLRLLHGYRGILVTDGYAAYDDAARALGFTHAGCMAHARRYFDEAKKTGSDSARVALDFIGKLSLIERSLWDDDHPLTPEQRVEIRQHRSHPIMQEFHAWLEAYAPKVLPESRLGKAMHYTLGQWSKLGVFLTHGDVPMHNNRCENAIRPFCRGAQGLALRRHCQGRRREREPVLPGRDRQGQWRRALCLSLIALRTSATPEARRGLRGGVAMERDGAGTTLTPWVASPLSMSALRCAKCNRWISPIKRPSSMRYTSVSRTCSLPVSCKAGLVRMSRPSSSCSTPC